MSRTRGGHIRRAGVMGASLLVVVALFISACGDDEDSSSAAAGGGGAAASTDKLSVTVGGVGDYEAPIYIAAANGYFKDAGVDVDISVGAANVIPLVVGGRADLGAVGMNTALVPVKDGKETSLIFVNQANVANAIFAGRPEVKDPKQCKRTATAAAGTSAATWAVTYQKLLDADYKVVNISDPPSQLGTVASGQNNCIVGGYPTFGAGLEDGKIHFLIDPRDPNAIPEGAPDTPGVAIWGMTDNLAEKKSAVEKFQVALKQAADFIKDSSPEDIATALRKNKDFQAFDLETLTSQVKFDQPFLVPNGGHLPEEQWADALKLAKDVIPEIDANDEKWSYAKRVDMSTWEAAN